jgi:hypothetical protein
MQGDFRRLFRSHRSVALKPSLMADLSPLPWLGSDIRKVQFRVEWRPRVQEMSSITAGKTVAPQAMILWCCHVEAFGYQR